MTTQLALQPPAPGELRADQDAVIAQDLNADAVANVEQVVLHLVNHGTLHRGQVMGMIRQLGIVPPGAEPMSTSPRTCASSSSRPMRRKPISYRASELKRDSNLGKGDPASIFPRSPRLSFEEVCRID